MKVCTNAYTVTKKDNYFSVMTDSVEIRILFFDRFHPAYQGRI